jgi:hypothetical protein
MLAAVVLVVVGLSLWRQAAVVPGNDDRADVERAVRRYNQALTEGYRALNMNGMREVATQLQSEDEYIHMSSLAEGGVRLDPELRDFEFLAASVESTSGTAETCETWDYRHYSTVTGELTMEQKGLEYHLAWDLERQSDGSWLVSDVRAISSTATVPPTQYATGTPPPHGTE